MASDQTNPPDGAPVGPTSALAWETVLDLGPGPGPLHLRLEQAIRDAVHAGRAPVGSALPPSRLLAQTLGVSRWVVTQAYGQLVAEGFLDARAGSATRVAAAARPGRCGAGDRGERPGPATGHTLEHTTGHRAADAPALAPLPGRARLDLAPGVPDLRHAPRDAWVRAVRTAVGHASNADLAVLPPAGHPRVRAVVAQHLRRARVVDGGGDAVVLTRGATDGMDRVARALVARGHRTLLVEDPSWPRLRDVARDAGLDPVPVPVDDGGVDVRALVTTAGHTGARAALVTPAHQFPTGAALAPERREALVAWAREADALVVEDDYDAEFRYDRRPVAALQQLDPERVLLLGSLSKTASPAFALGWAVVPPRWRDAVERASGPAPAPSAVDQLTFAELVTSGDYDRHLRAARGRYRRRRDAVLAALARELPGARVSGIAAGMHVLVDLRGPEHATGQGDSAEQGDGTAPGAPTTPDAAFVVREAAARGVAVADLRRYRVIAPDRSHHLVLGYGNLADARVDEAVSLLAEAVRYAARAGR